MTTTRLPLVIGHRGAPGYRPEHTRASYEVAIAQGADAIEPDIVATKDGVLVLRHENEISGTTDVAARPEFAGRRTTKEIDGEALTGWFTEDFTWSELRELRTRERLPAVRQTSATLDGEGGILRLVDLLELLDRSAEEQDRPVGLVAEIKHATYFASIGLPLDDLVATELVRQGWNSGDGRLTIESFEKSALNKVRARGIRSKNVFLLEAVGCPPDLLARDGSGAETYASFLTEPRLRELRLEIEGISVEKRMASSELVDSAHRADLDIFCWTLRPENRFLDRQFRRGFDASAFGDWEREFAMILATGVDGVFADHADLAVAARQTLWARRGAVGGSA